MATYYYMQYSVGASLTTILTITMPASNQGEDNINLDSTGQSEICTCTTNTAHNLVKDQLIFIAGNSVGAYNGPWAVKEVINAQAFTFLIETSLQAMGIGGTLKALGKKETYAEDYTSYYTNAACTTNAVSALAYGDTVHVTAGSLFDVFTYPPDSTIFWVGQGLIVGDGPRLIIHRNGIFYATGSDGVFSPQQAALMYAVNMGGTVFGTINPNLPVFYPGAQVQTQYSGFSFGPAIPLSDQTMPNIDMADKNFGEWTVFCRNVNGALTEPSFPPQVIPMTNGLVDVNSSSTVTKSSVGRYRVDVQNSNWKDQDTVDVYVEIEGVPVSYNFILSPPSWQNGGGTAPVGVGYRVYRSAVCDLNGLSDSIASAIADIHTLSSTVTSGFINTNTLVASGFLTTDVMITSSYVNLSSEISNIEATLLSSAFTSQVGSAVSSSLSSTLAADIAHDVTADILASNAPLNIVQTNPVVRGTQITLVKGDDYDVSTGQPIVFTDNGTWPNLTGTEVKFSIAYWQNVNSTLVLSCICATAGGPPQTVTVPLSSALTYTLTPGLGYVYDVRAQMSSHEVRTLVNNGNLLVNEPITTGF